MWKTQTPKGSESPVKAASQAEPTPEDAKVLPATGEVSSQETDTAGPPVDPDNETVPDIAAELPTEGDSPDRVADAFPIDVTERVTNLILIVEMEAYLASVADGEPATVEGYVEHLTAAGIG